MIPLIVSAVKNCLRLPEAILRWRQAHRPGRWQARHHRHRLAACAAPPPAAKPALGDDVVASAEVVTQSGAFSQPLDSIPNPAEDTIYFTATGEQGQGVFRVPASGGAAEEIATGAPFIAPRGIAIGSDGKLLYVADPQAGAGGKQGLIYVLPAAGDTPTPLRGTQGTSPRGMDVVSEGGVDVVYFTGNDPGDGQPAVLKIPAAGGDAPVVIAKGVPLTSPDGVVVSKAKVVYVSDQSAAGGNLGSVLKVEGGVVSKIADGLRLGEPGGVALTPDDAVLLVSSIDRDKGTDQVLLIHLSSLQTGLVTKVVGQNRAAGGVHRAPNKSLFSWADSSAGANGRGQVYAIRLH